MTPFVHTLALPHAAADGSDPQTFYASSGGMTEVAPDGSQYIPCLSVDTRAATVPSAVVDRRTVKAPTGKPQARTVSLLRQITGYTDAASPLVGRLIEGRVATFSVSRGTTGDGVELTVAAPYILAKGPVTAFKGLVRNLFQVELTISPQNVLAERKAPTETMLGYQEGLLFDGVDDVVVTPYTTMPTEVTLTAAVLLPRLWDVAGSDTQTIWASQSCWYGFKQTSGYKITFFVQYTTDAGGTLQEIEGPEFEPDETIHQLTCRFDTAAAGGGVDVRFGINAVWTDGADATAFHSLSTAWQMGRYMADNTTVLSTLVSGLMLYSAWLTDAETASVINARATGDEANLEMFYPGDVVGADLFDYTINNATAPRDATITGATHEPFFEGPEEMANSKPPWIAQGRHMPIMPVSTNDNAYRVTRHHIERIPADGILDGGAPYTVLPRYSVKGLLTGTAPGATEVAYTPWMGGLMLFGSDPGGLQIAADVKGCSGWLYSLALGGDHSDAQAEFPAGLNTLVLAQTQYALELWFSAADSGPGNSDQIFDSQWVDVARSFTTNDPVNTLRVSVSSTGLTKIFDFRSAPNTTVALRVEAINEGADMRVRVLISGKLISSVLHSGVNVRTAAMSVLPTLSNTGASFAHAGVLPMRLWSTVGSSDADAEAKHQQYLFSNPDPGASGLIGLWYRPTTDLDQLDDEVSTNHGAITPTSTEGSWFPGLCWSDPLAAAAKVMRDFGDVAEADITISEAAWQNVEPATQDLWVPANTSRSLTQLVHEAIGPGYAQIGRDGTVTLGMIVDATSGNSSGTITADEFVFIGEEIADDLPPSRIEGKWGASGVQQTPEGGSSAERRALMTEPFRRVSELVGSNATLYLDSPPPDGRFLEDRSRFRDRPPAVRSATALATMWEAARYRFEITLKGGYRTDASMAPGLIKTLRFSDGSEVHVLLVGREAGPGPEKWTVR